ncbi:MAG TPA: rod shape-determining protein MreC [Methylomirabilota bacterium]|nr:rod shape-determining protein MreC [Methylomirabilota bacterium]
MKRRIGALAWIAAPFRAWNQRLTLALLGAAAIALLAVERTSPTLAERARGAAADVIAPILDLLSRPSTSAAHAIDSVRELARLREENTQLKEEQARLLQWQTVARRLDHENQELRTLLNLAPDPKARFITARVVGGSGGAFVRSILVAAGARDGLRKNQAAITGEGLVGRVSEVGDRAARILLLTDINSRVPVFVERTRERAVLAGDNSDRMQLLYLPADITAREGDRIVTSGHGGVFPPGLPVGVITSIKGGVALVQPYVDWEQLEYVRLVDYELGGLLLPMAGQEQPLGPR